MLVGGAMFLVLGPAKSGPTPEPHDANREPIVIGAQRLEQIRARYERETGFAATEAAVDALLDREIDDEILYREALAHGLHLRDRSIEWRMAKKMSFLESEEGQADAPTEELYRRAVALGLDRDDIVVRRILVHKMRLLVRLRADDDVPTDEQLRDYFEQHAEDYRQPARVTFAHAYLARAKHGDRLEQDGRALSAELSSRSAPPTDAWRYGEPFGLGHEYRSRSRAGMAKVFGDAFAARVLALEPGRWSEPITSAFGVHVVYVVEKEASSIPELESVRSRLLRRYVDERREAHLERTLERLRAEYEIVIARPGMHEEPRS